MQPGFVAIFLQWHTVQRIFARNIQGHGSPIPTCREGRLLFAQRRDGEVTLSTDHGRALYHGEKSRFVEYFLSRLVDEFGGHHDALPHALDGLREVMPQWPGPNATFVDVGAGLYGSNADKAHAAEVLKRWGCVHGTRVLAFEPNKAARKRARDAVLNVLQKQLGSHAAALEWEKRAVVWYAAAVSDKNGTLETLRGHENGATIGRAVPTRTIAHRYEQKVGEVETMSLEVIAERHKINHIDFLKVDAEGHDFAVLLGGQQLLEAGNISLLAWELGANLNPHYYANWVERRRLPPPPGGPRGLEHPNLLSVVRWLDERRYDCFFLGTQILVPITGVWWDDQYDVCMRSEGLPCWYDMLCVHRKETTLATSVWSLATLPRSSD